MAQLTLVIVDIISFDSTLFLIVHKNNPS